MKMNPVVHFEMPAEDRQRMADFYAKVFGWKTKMLGPEMGEYVLATTTESEEKDGMPGLPKTPGAINGGFYKKTTNPTSNHPSVVIAVDDIGQAMRDIAAAGGEVLGGQTPGQPDDIPGVGLYAAFLDTEGNRVGMLQPSMQ